MTFVVPGKGVYGGLTLSSPADDETINIGPLVKIFEFEQRLPEEDGTPQDIIVLGVEKLSHDGREYGYPFFTAFVGDLPSVRRLSFLPLSEDYRSRYEYRHFPEVFLPIEPLTLDVGIVERTTRYGDNSREYSVVLQVL